jgi:hypothetical protein
VRTRWTTALLTLAVALGMGCYSDSPQASQTTTAADSSAGPARGTTPFAPAAKTGGIIGTVVETMDSGGYTYVLVDVGITSQWAAGPPVAVSPGATVRFNGSMQMTDYYSKTLDRTFDRIYFTGAIEVIKAGTGTVDDAPGAGDTPDVEPPATPSVEPAQGGVTVEQVFAQRDELVGTEIVLRGEVVKYNGGILGANWLHIQDGTGAEGTNDLTVTTAATAAVGDTVTVRRGGRHGHRAGRAGRQPRLRLRLRLRPDDRERPGHHRLTPVTSPSRARPLAAQARRSAPGRRR